ncbi:hypothetical protein AMTR_s00025p00060620 [Amborella trichopoda]|uniref:Transmembrane protein n=1 Tax=Amborella trichopoda TaxID=13333 RepID=W1PWQ6_AMBTC|nr:hypothetical protein AMTR_s00025p00060620 [Amborella trichopoda]
MALQQVHLHQSIHPPSFLSANTTILLSHKFETQDNNIKAAQFISSRPHLITIAARKRLSKSFTKTIHTSVKWVFSVASNHKLWLRLLLSSTLGNTECGAFIGGIGNGGNLGFGRRFRGGGRWWRRGRRNRWVALLIFGIVFMVLGLHFEGKPDFRALVLGLWMVVTRVRGWAGWRLK